MFAGPVVSREMHLLEVSPRILQEGAPDVSAVITGFLKHVSGCSALYCEYRTKGQILVRTNATVLTKETTGKHIITDEHRV